MEEYPDYFEFESVPGYQHIRVPKDGTLNQNFDYIRMLPASVNADENRERLAYLQWNIREQSRIENERQRRERIRREQQEDAEIEEEKRRRQGRRRDEDEDEGRGGRGAPRRRLNFGGMNVAPPPVPGMAPAPPPVPNPVHTSRFSRMMMEL
jgi:hypothetical protein